MVCTTFMVCQTMKEEILLDQSCQSTGGPPLTQKSLTQFPLPRFLAYVRASGGFLCFRGFTTVPLTRISCNTVFSKSQNAHKVGTLCNLFYGNVH